MVDDRSLPLHAGRVRREAVQQGAHSVLRLPPLTGRHWLVVAAAPEVVRLLLLAVLCSRPVRRLVGRAA